jgi:hypothetical protein
MSREPEPRMIPNPLWCDRCEGLGYLVADAEWKPYAVQCPDCRERRAETTKIEVLKAELAECRQERYGYLGKWDKRSEVNKTREPKP